MNKIKIIIYISLFVSLICSQPILANQKDNTSKNPFLKEIELATNKNIHIDSSIILLKNIIDKSIISKDCEAYQTALAKLSGIYMIKSEPVEIIKITEALISSPLNCKIINPVIYLNCANSYSQLGDYKRTLELIDLAVSITKNDTTDLIRVYFQAGYIWSKLPKSLQPLGYKKALEYFQVAEKLLEKQHNLRNYAIFLNDEADIYLRMKDWKKSLEKLEIAKSICIKNNLKLELKGCLLTEAEVYFNQNNFSLCLQRIDEINKIQLDVPFKYIDINTGLLQAKVYYKLKNISAALAILNTMDENELINQGYFPPLQDLYEIKSEIYSSGNDYKNSLLYYKKYNAIKDSIMNENTVMSVQYWDFKSKSDEKNKILLERERLIHQQEKMLNRNSRWILILIFFAVIIVLVFLSYFLWQKQRKKQVQNQQKTHLYRAISAAEQTERARIAKELHDSVAGMLTIAGMNMMEAKRNNFNNETQVEKIQQLINHSSIEIRKAIHNLLPSALEKNDLISAVELYCSEINQSENLIIDIESKGDFKKLDLLWSLSLYRIIQELLNNIIKHSNATHSLVILEILDDTLQILIEDNGVGFNLVNELQQNHNGLKNIMERVNNLGGKISIDSQLNIGTSVEIKFNVIV